MLYRMPRLRHANYSCDTKSQAKLYPKPQIAQE